MIWYLVAAIVGLLVGLFIGHVITYRDAEKKELSLRGDIVTRDDTINRQEIELSNLRRTVKETAYDRVQYKQANQLLSIATRKEHAAEKKEEEVLKLKAEIEQRIAEATAPKSVMVEGIRASNPVPEPIPTPAIVKPVVLAVENAAEMIEELHAGPAPVVVKQEPAKIEPPQNPPPPPPPVVSEPPEVVTPPADPVSKSERTPYEGPRDLRHIAVHQRRLRTGKQVSVREHDRHVRVKAIAEVAAANLSPTLEYDSWLDSISV